MRLVNLFVLTLVIFVLALVSDGLHGQPQQPQQQGAAPQPAVRGANNETIGPATPGFATHCAGCHDSGANNAPDMTVIRQFPPERIYQAITTGPMQAMAKDLSDADKKALAETISGRRLATAGDTSASAMTDRCTSNPPLSNPESGPSWNGWSPSLGNNRFQSASVAKLQAGQIARLKLKWAFGVPLAESLYNQPTIVGGRIYISSDTGQVYSLDAATGCPYWSFQAESGVRTAMTVANKPGSQQQLLYFGDIRGNVYAVDAREGELMWKMSADSSAVARIIGAPKFYKDRLYVSVAGLEEGASHEPFYPCCTSRGAVVALDASTGKVIWKTYTIPDQPKFIQKNSGGIDVFGPSGASIWDSPTIDSKRNALYVGTGNGFTGPATKFTDAVMAMDLDTGKVLWSFQATAHDIWHGGCVQAVPGRNPNGGGVTPGTNYPPESCSTPSGPDWDFSASPILTTLANGRDLLVAGQKSGTVWAIDVDNHGAVVWSADVARILPGGGGEIVFGGAADSHNAYFNLRSGGIVALDLETGLEKWYTPFVPPATAQAPAGQQGPSAGGSTGAPPSQTQPPTNQNAGAPAAVVRRGASSAVTLIPGVVLTGGIDGTLRAFLANSGQLIWEFNTLKQYDSVNKVPAKGGSIGSAGPVVVDGTLYLTSGYIGYQNGIPGNALLAFSTGE